MAAAGAAAPGVPVDCMLFALTLPGVPLFHHRTLRAARHRFQYNPPGRNGRPA